MGRGRPEGMAWYAAAFVAIYTFHMPFFMYLSGSTAWISGQATAPPAAWPRQIARRAQRLLVPFVLMGLVIVIGKYFASKVMHVDGVPPGLAEGLQDAFWTTAESPVIMIWYLWVLFFVATAAPLLLRLPGVPERWRVAPALAVGLVLFVTLLPAIAYLDRLAAHAVFFAAGLAVAQAGPRALASIDRWWPVGLALLGAGIAATLLGVLERRWALLPCGLASLPALHGLVRAIGGSRIGPRLLWLGRYSMVIYLFNTIAIGLAKAALIKAGLAWTATGATLATPILMLAGVGAPVLGKWLVLRHIPPLDRITD